jgi:hypothetical protein
MSPSTMSFAQVAYLTIAPAPALVPTRMSDSGQSAGAVVSTTFTVNCVLALWTGVIGHRADDRRDLVQQEEVRRRRYALEQQSLSTASCATIG